jgi:hypothetical protein
MERASSLAIYGAASRCIIPMLWNTDSPDMVRLITDTLCGVSPLPDSAPGCYNEFKTEGMMDHNRFDDLAEPWLRRLVAR